MTTTSVEIVAGQDVEIIEYDVKETAAELRQTLREEFPGVKFSVRMARGSAYGWLDCAWTDGPTTSQVLPILGRFEGSRFDGRDDSYRQVAAATYAREDGSRYSPRYSSCGIITHRTHSAEARAWAAGVVTEGSHWWSLGEQHGDAVYYGTHRLLDQTDLTDGFPAVAPKPN
ncbi:MAG: LPD29 domain-containing protein [Nocardioides sp.]|uniref:LPD29 domain-containing protein n=1 Tax=Nocardioides sp. TaxID=35761 RepID=UPI003D6ABFCE